MLIYCSILENDKDKTFEMMYYRYRKLLLKIANDILHDSDLAEDAVSQTFWRAAENFSKFSRPICPETKRFLVIVCERISIDLYRKRKRENLIFWEDTEFNPTEAIIYPEEAGTLEAAIARLPQTYRDVILLRYHYGYSVREIADILNFSEAKVEKTITRAKHRLENALEEEG